MTSGRSHGFTLIELIIATGMVAMLTLSLYVGLATAFRAKAAIGRQTDSMRQAKVALDLVEQDLRSVMPPGTLPGPFIGQGTSVGGAVSIIDFFSLGSDYGNDNVPTGDGFRHIQFALTNDTNPIPPGSPAGTTPGQMLIRSIVRNVVTTAEPEPETEILARNISDFSIRYYDGAAWADTWDSTALSNALPLAAEVTIQIKAPTPEDVNKVYKMTRVVRMSCGLTAEQAAAIAAAASGTTTTTTDPMGNQ